MHLCAMQSFMWYVFANIARVHPPDWRLETRFALDDDMDDIPEDRNNTQVD